MGLVVHREDTRLSETVLQMLCCAVCSNETQSSHHVTTCVEMARHTDVSVMFPICTPDASISRLKLTVHQVLISEPGMSHHQTTSGMERQSQLGLF